MKDNGKSMTKNFECKGIHPYPLFFSSSQPLISGVKYLLSLRLLFTINEKDLEIPVETIWGFQGTMFENRQKSLRLPLSFYLNIGDNISIFQDLWRKNSNMNVLPRFARNVDNETI